MRLNTSLLVSLWLASFAGFLAVAGLRLKLGRSEDDHLHVLDQDAHLVGDQAATARKLDRLDKWRTVLLTATLVLGIALAALMVYDAWQRGSMPNT